MADSFDAMTSDRPYRKALSHKRAIQTLLEGRGKQWDPNIVNAFVDMIGDQLDEKPDIRCTDHVVASERLQTSPMSPRRYRIRELANMPLKASSVAQYDLDKY